MLIVWESCKWINESNSAINQNDQTAVWESCKWINESNDAEIRKLPIKFESLVSE